MVVASLADEPSDTAGDAGGDGRAALLGERTTTDTEDGGVVRRAALLGRLVTSSSSEEDGEDKLMVAIAAATCLPRREAGKDGGILGAMAGINNGSIGIGSLLRRLVTSSSSSDTLMTVLLRTEPEEMVMAAAACSPRREARDDGGIPGAMVAGVLIRSIQGLFIYLYRIEIGRISARFVSPVPPRRRAPFFYFFGGNNGCPPIHFHGEKNLTASRSL